MELPEVKVILCGASSEVKQRFCSSLARKAQDLDAAPSLPGSEPAGAGMFDVTTILMQGFEAGGEGGALVQVYDTKASRRIKRFWYPLAGCFVLLFSVDNRASFKDVLTHWAPLIRESAPSVPMILVGTAAHLRRRPDTATSPRSPRTPRGSSLLVSTEEAYAAAMQLRCSYFECSMITGENIKPILRAAHLLGLHYRLKDAMPEAGWIKPWSWYAAGIHSKLLAVLAALLHLQEGESRDSFSLTGMHLEHVPLWLLDDLSNVSSLTHVDLSDNRIRELPREIANLFSLENLDVSSNRLNILPADLALLATLRKLKYRGNPLKLVPKSVLRGGERAMWGYLRGLSESQTQWKRLKLLFVGKEAVGKSSLMRCLVGSGKPLRSQSVLGLQRRGKKVTKSESAPMTSVSTNGVAVQLWKPRSTPADHRLSVIGRSRSDTGTSSTASGKEKSDLELHCWDFGGQEIFYPTHQFFLTGRSIYVIVFNLCHPEHEKIEYWLQQIELVSNQVSTVVIVGTHADDEMCTHDYVQETLSHVAELYQSRFTSIKLVTSVSCRTQAGIPELTKAIVDFAAAHAIVRKLVPGSWAALDTAVALELEAGKQTLDAAAFLDMARACGVKSSQVEHATTFLHDTGRLLFFPDPRKKMDSLYVVDPQWLTSVMASVVTFRHSWVRNGILLESNWPHVWSAYPEHLHATLFGLLERFEVAHALRGSPPRCLIPSLLDNQASDSVVDERFPAPKDCAVRFARSWKFSFLPIGVFDRLMVRALHIEAAEMVTAWRHGLLMQYESEYALALYDAAEHTISIEVRALAGKAVILQQLTRDFEDLLDTMYVVRADQVHITVPCVHCWEKAVAVPYSFAVEEIVLAVSRGAPFVYCHGLPSRPVRVDHLAPDLTLASIPSLEHENILLEKALGEGGFGVVYKGRLTEGGKEREVAVKELQPCGGQEEEVEQFHAFRHESYIMACLDHPALVKLIGTTTSSPLLMVMEYVSGGTLYELLHKDGLTDALFPLPLRYLLALDVARGMQYLHSISPPIVHRDLRSPNVLIASLDPTAKVRAKVADFGLARAVAPTSGGALATWQWLAPEVMDPSVKTYDERVDTYSFGILMWEIMVRAFPFEEFATDPRFVKVIVDDTGAETSVLLSLKLKAAIYKDGLRPSMPDAGLHVAPEYLSIMQRCWSHAASDRPSFEEVVEVLTKLTDFVEMDDHMAALAKSLRTHKRSSSVTIKTSHKQRRRARVLLRQSLQPSSKQVEVEEKEQVVFALSRLLAMPHIAGAPLCLLASGGNVWCGSVSGHLIVYSGATFEVLTSWRPHSTPINALAVVNDTVWSSSESYAIDVWCADALVRIGRVTTDEKKTRHLAAMLGAKTTVWSSSGKGLLQQWDPETHHCLATVDLGLAQVGAMATTLSGLLWVADGSRFVVYSPATGKLLPDAGAKAEHTRLIRSMVGVAGTEMWTCGADGKICCWDMDSYDLVSSSFAHGCPVHCLLEVGIFVWSSGQNSSLIIWDGEEHVPMQEIEGYHQEPVTGLAVTGCSIWSSSPDGTICVWGWQGST